jgi:hypothetical protein
MTMTAIEFTVETTFDLPSRGGILVPGQLKTGVIRRGTTLRTETDRTVRVLGVEFHSSVGSTPETRRVTLLIERADATAIRTGTVLTNQT